MEREGKGKYQEKLSQKRFGTEEHIRKLEQMKESLCDMCPNTEVFLVHIFLHLDWVGRDTKYFSVFSPNAGKYGPEKTPYLNTFHAVNIIAKENLNSILPCRLANIQKGSLYEIDVSNKGPIGT